MISRISISRQCACHFARIQPSRNFQLSLSNLKNATVNRQVKILQKLLGSRESGSKKRWYPNDERSSSQIHQVTTIRDLGKAKRQGKNASRRINVLNKLFMKHITDQLATGSVSHEILGKGLEISRVKITQDFYVVNVYWIAKGTCSDIEIEKILHRCSGLLRHELSQLRLMGEVPRIHFVKDKTFANLADVVNSLRDCDFGEDYEETDLNSEQIRSELGLTSSFEEDEDALPVMRHDVLGLNHKEIMMGILTKMKRSKDAWKAYEMRDGGDVEDETLNASSTLPTPKLDAIRKRMEEMKENDECFQKFLQSRTFKKETPERKKPIRLEEGIGFDESYDDELMNSGRNSKEEDYLEDVENRKI